MENVLMKCGHTTSIKDSDGNYVCPICVGLTPNARIAEEKKVDLKNRTAKCTCGCERPSNYNLPFFEYCPNSQYDSFYCGCRGWD